MSNTASTMRCRSCRGEIGSSFLYSADGFAYHHECFPGNSVDKASAWDAIAAKNAEISRLTADNEELRKENERLLNAHLPAATVEAILSGQRSMEAAFEQKSRADALAQEVEKLRELVQKAFKDGVLYGTNVDVSDVWQAWLSSKVRAELAAASRPLPLQETEK